MISLKMERDVNTREGPQAVRAIKARLIELVISAIPELYAVVQVCKASVNAKIARVPARERMIDLSNGGVEKLVNGLLYVLQVCFRARKMAFFTEAQDA